MLKNIVKQVYNYSIFWLVLYLCLLFTGSLWPKLSRHYQTGEISSGLTPKEGDNFKMVNVPAVYKLVDGKRCKYTSDTSFYNYPDNPPFDTPYENGGILICDKAVVFAIPMGDFMPIKPGGEAAKYQHKTASELFYEAFFRKDKVKHFFAYAVLAILMLVVFQDYTKLSFVWQSAAVFVLGTFIGVVIELLQFEYIPGRDKEELDMLLNAIGTLGGILFYKRFRIKKSD